MSEILGVEEVTTREIVRIRCESVDHARELADRLRNLFPSTVLAIELSIAYVKTVYLIPRRETTAVQVRAWVDERPTLLEGKEITTREIVRIRCGTAGHARDLAERLREYHPHSGLAMELITVCDGKVYLIPGRETTAVQVRAWVDSEIVSWDRVATILASHSHFG